MQFEGYLYGKKLHESFLGEQPKGMDDNDRKLVLLDRLGVIQLTMSRSNKHNVVKDKTTIGLIATLSDMYEKSSANNKMHLNALQFFVSFDCLVYVFSFFYS